MQKQLSSTNTTMLYYYVEERRLGKKWGVWCVLA